MGSLELGGKPDSIKTLIRRYSILEQEAWPKSYISMTGMVPDTLRSINLTIYKIFHPNKEYLYPSNSNSLFNLQLASFQTMVPVLVLESQKIISVA